MVLSPTPTPEGASGFSDSARQDGAPERRCLATRQARPKADLIRFVVAPDGMLTPDLEAKLPGRGLYVSPEREALAKAVKKGLFSRAAKMAVTVPADLPDRLEALIAQRCVEHLSLARRAGAAVAGYDKVRAWLVQAKPLLVLAARDGAADGRGKIAALARAHGATVASPLTRQELARAFGREDAVHAAIEINAGFASLRRYADWLDAMRNQADKPIAAAKDGASPCHVTPDKA